MAMDIPQPSRVVFSFQETIFLHNGQIAFERSGVYALPAVLNLYERFGY
jgi:hypothetical protein